MMMINGSLGTCPLSTTWTVSRSHAGNILEYQLIRFSAWIESLSPQSTLVVLPLLGQRNAIRQPFNAAAGTRYWQLLISPPGIPAVIPVSPLGVIDVNATRTISVFAIDDIYFGSRHATNGFGNRFGGNAFGGPPRLIRSFAGAPGKIAGCWEPPAGPGRRALRFRPEV